MNFRISADVKMDRPIDPNLYSLSAGGYSILSSNILYRFDFLEYAIYVDSEDACVIHIAGKYLDLDTFPLAANITEDVLRNISNFTEFFIYTGEPDEDCPAPVSLDSCAFEIVDTGEVIDVPASVCKAAYITRGF